MSASATARVRENMARRHFNTANLFANRCIELEQANSSQPWPQSCWQEHQSYASASVIMSGAALEAFINEFFLDACDGGGGNLSSIQPPTLKLLEQLWLGFDRISPLRKFQVALTACSVDPFPLGEEPYQSAADLLALRNALVHFKPEWDDEPGEHMNLERRLAGKFATNSLAPPTGMKWFTGRCLGSGCASWALEGVRTFMMDFFKQLKVPYTM